jgi:hypothetical protein
MLNTFAAQWRYDFDPDSVTWPTLVDTWQNRLQPYDDETVEKAVNHYLDTESRPPRVADILDGCRSFRPREVHPPDYLDGPRQGLTEAGDAALYQGPKKDLWTRQQHLAAEKWRKLIEEVGEARRGNDAARLARAEQAMRDARSSQAYRRWQVYWVDKTMPGAAERLPPLPQVCDLCQGQQVVQVAYRWLSRVPFHWVRLKTGKDDHPNQVGVLYHCPRCVTPTKAEQDDYEAQAAQPVYA